MQVHARRIGLLALVFGIAFLSAGRQVTAQANPFLGQWELDRFKSVYEPITTAPEKQIVTIANATSAGQITVTTRTWRNAVANETSYTVGLDGKDYPTSAANTAVAFKRVNANTLERTAKLLTDVAETATWSVSADGKMLTIKREGVDTTGTAYSSTSLYTKIG
jgi:hypothetical protein